MGPDAADPNGVGDLVMLPGSHYSDPEFSWSQPVGVTSIGFMADSLMDASYRDAVLVGDDNSSRLYLFRLNQARDGFVFDDPDIAEDGVADPADLDSITFGTGFSTTTDIQTGPDGAIYLVALFGDSIQRIAPVVLLGDANNDGKVTGLDLIAVQQAFGNAEPGQATGLLLGDANDDAVVSGQDLITVQQQFGNTVAPPSPVPEPVAAVAALLLATARWRRRQPKLHG
jgi:hypothetical protein